MKRFFRSLKSEWVPKKGYSSFNEAQTSIAQYIVGYYSHQIKQRQSTALSLIPWPVLLGHRKYLIHYIKGISIAIFISLVIIFSHHFVINIYFKNMYLNLLINSSSLFLIFPNNYFLISKLFKKVHKC